MKIIPFKKLSKKAKKKINAEARTVVPFNTGTREMKTAKHPTRQEMNRRSEEE